MLNNIRADLRAQTGDSTLLKFKVVLFSHSFHMVALYRFGCMASKAPWIGVIVRPFIEYFIRIFFSSDISLKSRIGPGLVILHGHDIVIGADVFIGARCKIFNGVTLGNKNTESTVNFQPSIGDDVILSTGCKVLGGVAVGANAIIGANSVVLKDVPANTIAVGVPAIIKKRKNL